MACNVLIGDDSQRTIPVVLTIREGTEKALEEAKDSVYGAGFVLDFNAAGQRVKLDIQFDTDLERNGEGYDRIQD